MKFERAARECWERSIYNYIGFLRSVSDTFDTMNQLSGGEAPTFDYVHKYAWDLEFKVFKNEILLQVEVVMNEKDYSLSLEPSAE